MPSCTVAGSLVIGVIASNEAPKRCSDVLDLFASGFDAAQILDEMPDLEADDLKACLTFARRRIDHPLLAA